MIINSFHLPIRFLDGDISLNYSSIISADSAYERENWRARAKVVPSRSPLRRFAANATLR